MAILSHAAKHEKYQLLEAVRDCVTCSLTEIEAHCEKLCIGFFVTLIICQYVTVVLILIGLEDGGGEEN